MNCELDSENCNIVRISSHHNFPVLSLITLSYSWQCLSSSSQCHSSLHYTLLLLSIIISSVTTITVSSLFVIIPIRFILMFSTFHLSHGFRMFCEKNEKGRDHTPGWWGGEKVWHEAKTSIKMRTKKYFSKPDNDDWNFHDDSFNGFYIPWNNIFVMFFFVWWFEGFNVIITFSRHWFSPTLPRVASKSLESFRLWSLRKPSLDQFQWHHITQQL